MSIDWISRCFVCEETVPGGPGLPSSQSVCPRCRDSEFANLVGREFGDDLDRCFVTLIPEPQHYQQELLPKFAEYLHRILFIRNRPVTEKGSSFLPELGWDLPDLAWRYPVVNRSESLEAFSGVGEVLVLDASNYGFSGTMKDLRSAAILGQAAAMGTRHLALWSAGNAGLSLAKTVFRYNQLVPDNERKAVYCAVDVDVSREIIVALRSVGCHVLPMPLQGSILYPAQTRSIVESILPTGGGRDPDIWEVTDGWEGYGMFLYRLLIYQAIQTFRPDYLVVPVGTGALLIGAVLGSRDASQRDGSSTKIVGAYPAGGISSLGHALATLESDVFRRSPSAPGAPPLAPKLEGVYSPLFPCLASLVKKEKMAPFGRHTVPTFVGTDQADQVTAGAQLLKKGHDLTIAAEPSALVAFGCIRNLSSKVRASAQKNMCGTLDESRVLVFNSGFGIVGRDEQDFCHSLLSFG